MVAAQLNEFTDLPPRYVVEYYRKAYTAVNAIEPRVRYIGNQWYQVNGELVHRITLVEEILRLRSLSQKKQLKNTDKSLINRLIAKLRGM